MLALRFLLVLGHPILRRLQRRVHRVIRQVQKERPRLVLLDELLCLHREPIREILALPPIRQRVPVRVRMLARHAPLAVVREKIIARVAHVVAAHIQVKPLMLRIKLPVPAHMPLAHRRRRVPARLQRLRNGELLQRQILFVDCLDQRQRFLDPFRALNRNRMRDLQPSRILAGKDTHARRRTHATRRIRIGKFHSLLRQSIHMRRLIKIASIATEIRPPHVIHQKENHIRPLHRHGGVDHCPASEYHQESLSHFTSSFGG